MVRLSDGEVALMVAAWNAHNRVGTAVRVLLDDGSFRKSRTASEAWMVGPMPVVKFEGIGGGYSLLRVAVDWEEE
jgi:hypothetical protein